MPSHTTISQLPTIHVIGTMQFDPMWSEQWHEARHDEILYVLQGDMILEQEKHSHKLTQGDITVVPAGTLHRDHFQLNNPPTLFYISHTWPGINRFFATVTPNILQGLPFEFRRDIASLIDSLRVHLTSNLAHNELINRTKLHTLLLTLMSATSPRSQESTKSPAKRIVTKALQYMEEHFHECISLDDIAEALQISSYHLSHVFSQERDFSLFQHLTHLRITKAKALLKDGSLNISQIAHATGYENRNYFSKVFKKQTGLTPSQFAANP